MSTQDNFPSSVAHKNRKPLWIISLIALFLFITIAIYEAPTKPLPSLNLSNGSKLTLIAIGHGKRNLWFYDPNPVRRFIDQTKSWLGFGHPRNVLAKGHPMFRPNSSVLTYQPYTNAVVYWVRMDPAYINWTVNVVDNANDLLPDSRLFRKKTHDVSTTSHKDYPDLVGIIVNNCPTTTSNLFLGFYDSNNHQFAGGLTVKNPFYKR